MPCCIRRWNCANWQSNFTPHAQQAGAPLTPAQYALAQHHAAFRDFEALLLAFDAEHFSAEPAQGEWSAAVILAHVRQVERNFYAAILNTIRNPAPGFLSDEEVATLTGEPADIVPATELAAGWAAFARLHARLQAELAALTDAQLTMPSPYWEPEPWPTIGFRLHRFESHLREHTNQLEKSLAMLGIKRNEGRCSCAR
ncbi:MAG: DinB family protein [Caldilineaceae bacterium]|nr:DinB family protein [Caldilineaceae bacterium]